MTKWPRRGRCEHRLGLLERQAISGHRDMRMLQRYAHLCAGKLAAKMDEIRGTVTEYTHRGRRRTVVTAEPATASSFNPEAELEVAAAPGTGPRSTADTGLIAAAVVMPDTDVAPSGERQSANVIDFRSAARRVAVTEGGAAPTSGRWEDKG